MKIEIASGEFLEVPEDLQIGNPEAHRKISVEMDFTPGRPTNISRFKVIEVFPSSSQKVTFRLI